MVTFVAELNFLSWKFLILIEDERKIWMKNEMTSFFEMFWDENLNSKFFFVLMMLKICVMTFWK